MGVEGGPAIHFWEALLGMGGRGYRGCGGCMAILYLVAFMAPLEGVNMPCFIKHLAYLKRLIRRLGLV